MSIVAATIINIEAFIAASRCGPQPSQFSAIQNECTVNASGGQARHTNGRDLIVNSAQYQNDNEYSRKRKVQIATMTNERTITKAVGLSKTT